MLYARILSISNTVSDAQQVSIDGVATCLGLLVDTLEEYGTLAGTETTSAVVVTAVVTLLHCVQSYQLSAKVDDPAALVSLLGGIQSDLAVGEIRYNHSRQSSGHHLGRWTSRIQWREVLCATYPL